jgi:thiaminase (transcriptional activator TenA)
MPIKSLAAMLLDGTNIMTERFTETLGAASKPGWSHAVGHRFVKELFAGAVPDGALSDPGPPLPRQLLTLLGAVLASADAFEAKYRFARFIGMVSGEENTYFLRAFCRPPASTFYGVIAEIDI